jgi:hypothetical protein
VAGVSKAIACALFAPKAVDEIRITLFFRFFRMKKVIELVVTSNK